MARVGRRTAAVLATGALIVAGCADPDEETEPDPAAIDESDADTDTAVESAPEPEPEPEPEPTRLLTVDATTSDVSNFGNAGDRLTLTFSSGVSDDSVPIVRFDTPATTSNTWYWSVVCASATVECGFNDNVMTMTWPRTAPRFPRDLADAWVAELKDTTDVNGLDIEVAEPVPVANPAGEPEPEPEPEPEFAWPPVAIDAIEGSGDDFIVLDAPIEAAGMVYVRGNADGRFFAVRTVDQDGERIDGIVSSTDPYEGIRPIAFFEDVYGFEVESSGPWTIEVRSIEDARELAAGGAIEGSGDELLRLNIDGLTVANIVGNADERFFAVRAWNGGRDGLVSTTDAYDGTVRIPSDALLLEVEGVGNWSLSLE